MMRLTILISCLLASASAFTKPQLSGVRNIQSSAVNNRNRIVVSSSNEKEAALGEKMNGYTVKQRLREEVESPFRKVRLAFFGFSAFSALTALYFSALVAIKANIGGYADVPPLDEALVQVAINSGGALGFGLLAAREIKVGQGNLERIAKGGLLARLVVEPAAEEASKRTLKDYRRISRVIIAAGGAEYIRSLSMSLCSDQLADENTLPAALAGVDVMIVPVLLDENFNVVETKSAWRSATPGESDRNFDSTRADEVICFPSVLSMWQEYIDSDVKTAQGQGFDVLSKGITVTVKKNGRILRRATGLPPFGDMVGMMEVADGSKFGMPGDSEKYGGP
eukprot:scaffold12859_cov125-Skeletonema_dohrnii-CCMP3373.AAC.2